MTFSCLDTESAEVLGFHHLLGSCFVMGTEGLPDQESVLRVGL